MSEKQNGTEELVKDIIPLDPKPNIKGTKNEDRKRSLEERLLKAYRERDKPLLATPSAHGPG